MSSVHVVVRTTPKAGVDEKRYVVLECLAHRDREKEVTNDLPVMTYEMANRRLCKDGLVRARRWPEWLDTRVGACP